MHGNIKGLFGCSSLIWVRCFSEAGRLQIKPAREKTATWIFTLLAFKRLVVMLRGVLVSWRAAEQTHTFIYQTKEGIKCSVTCQYEVSALVDMFALCLVIKYWEMHSRFGVIKLSLRIDRLRWRCGGIIVVGATHPPQHAHAVTNWRPVQIGYTII